MKKDNRKNILITTELRDRLKLEATRQNKTMRDFLEQGIDLLISKLTAEERIVFNYEVKLEKEKEEKRNLKERKDQ